MATRARLWFFVYSARRRVSSAELAFRRCRVGVEAASKQTKVKFFHVRMNDAELALLTEAATAIGSPVSTWARVTLLAEARKVLRRVREQA